MIRGKLFLLLLVTGLAVAVHADEQSVKNRKLMTEEPIPVGSHAVTTVLMLDFDEKFDSASFREELALLLDLPVDRVRITQNFRGEGEIFTKGTHFVGVTIIDLTQAQETEVSAFFDDNPTFTLDSFGTVETPNGSEEVSNDIVTLNLDPVCLSVSATDFSEDDYIQAFDNALASTASVTTSIPFSVEENSPFCVDATPPGSTHVVTDIEVPAADLGAVLDLLPTASSTIDLGGDFGEVSLGNNVFLF